MSISDELRELAGEAGIYSNACVKLRKLADRIDSEMVELPSDKDGADATNIVCWVRNRGYVPLNPSDVTHTRPDSFERIADELEAAKGWLDQNGERNSLVSSVSAKTLGDWADRIRKLAKKED